MAHEETSDLPQWANNELTDANARIAVLEAKNDALKKAIRKQLAGLVKPLVWEGSESYLWYGNYYIEGYPKNWNPVLHGLWVGPTFDNKAEARAAAEAHHIETVLNLLNI